MENIKKRSIALLPMMVLALLAPIVYADQGNGGNLMGGQSVVSGNQLYAGDKGHMKHWLSHRLKLSDEQEKQMKVIRHQQREAQKAMAQQIKANREVLDQELLMPNPDMNKINGLQAQMKAFAAQMMDDRLNSTLEIKKVLSPEQFAQYLELKKKMFAHHSHWGHKGEK